MKHYPLPNHNGQPCSKCHVPMDRRSHQSITPKLLRKKYYFSQWDVCTTCKRVQHYERFKVFNPIKKRVVSCGQNPLSWNKSTINDIVVNR